MSKNKNEENDFFDERELKKNSHLEEDMDMSFVEPKKHHFFSIFIIIILILAICSGVAYFFVINTPKKLFITVFDKLISNSNYQISLNETGIKSSTFDYKFGVNINTDDSELKEFINVLNKLTITGTSNIDKDKNIIENNTIIEYKTEQLLDLTTKTDLDNNITYLYAKNLLDKVIKFDLDTSSNEQEDKTNQKDYLIISRSIFKAISASLQNAEYKRKIVKINNQYLKKQTIIIDSSFAKTLYTKLLQDDEFLESASNITKYTKEEISDEINKEMNELENTPESVSVYTTILKDEFIKFEYNAKGDSIIVTKDNDKYNFEYTEDYNLECQGYIKLNKENNSTLLTLNLDLVEDKTTFDITIEYSKKELGKYMLDTSNVTDYEKLTEEDENKITENISENKAFRYLIEDLGMLDQNEESSGLNA